jgi:hypothetical protein
VKTLIASVGGIVLGATLAAADPYAFGCGTVHPIARPEIANGVLLEDVQTYDADGSAGALAQTSNARTDGAPGHHVWPGLTDAHT